MSSVAPKVVVDQAWLIHKKHQSPLSWARHEEE